MLTSLAELKLSQLPCRLLKECNSLETNEFHQLELVFKLFGIPFNTILRGFIAYEFFLDYTGYVVVMLFGLYWVCYDSFTVLNISLSLTFAQIVVTCKLEDVDILALISIIPAVFVPLSIAPTSIQE